MRLKQGQLKALVATASLELGIDIGHVDLACQIGSPHRIATLHPAHRPLGPHRVRHAQGTAVPDLARRPDRMRGAAARGPPRRARRDRQRTTARSTCSPSRWWPKRRAPSTARMRCSRWCGGPGRSASLPRGDFDAVDRDGVRRLRHPARPPRRADPSRRGPGPPARPARRAPARAHLRRGDSRGRRLPGGARSRTTCSSARLNEDFAIESMAGDVFQLGNASWRVLQVAAGTVRVADAHGAPPNIPFWLGEAPARSDELSRAVSDSALRSSRALTSRADCARPAMPADAAAQRSAAALRLAHGRRPASPVRAAEQIAAYLADALRALGVLPTQETLVLERFFDESGGMQLVLHAPFGSRVNKAWGLALRKRFCRQFNFELQAAATEDGLLLSLGPQHSFPLAGRLPLSAPGDRARRAGPGVPRRAGVPDPLALEHDHLARGAAEPQRQEGAAAAAADARRRSDGGGVPGRGRLPREHSRRSADSRSSAGGADGPRLPERGDGLRAARLDARAHSRRRAPAGRRATRPSRRRWRTRS